MPRTPPATGTADLTDPMLIALRRAQQAQQRYRNRLLRRDTRAKRNHGGDRDGMPTSSPRRSPTQREGDRYEHAALLYLQQAGLRLVARNLRCRVGEIDLVMLDGQVLVFIEVRARKSSAFGGALASVTRCKQARLRRAAAYWLPILQRRLVRPGASGQISCRFDVLAFEGEDLHWVTHAFGADWSPVI